MVDSFGFRSGVVTLEEILLFVAIMGATFRGSVGCDGMIGQYILRSLRFRRMFVIMGG